MTNRSVDLGNLTLTDLNALPPGADSDTITARLVENIDFALTALLDIKKQAMHANEVLPEEEQIHDFQAATLALDLPAPEEVFPRSRKLPEVKKETKWQKFAKEKGIKKRKRTGMSYDPTLKQQVARWGRKSKKNALDLPIMEEKANGRDPFSDARTEKKLRVAKNRLKQAKNMQRP